MAIYNEIDLEEQYDKIYRYCYFKLQNQQVAEDITQETFLRFLESETYRSTGKVLRYLYTVARNLCIDEYRRRQRENLIEEFTENMEAVAGRLSKLNDEVCAEEHWVTTIAVKTALEELSEEERELILLRYVNEVPVSVICKLFGMSRFALYRRTKAVMEILQEKLGEEDFA